MKKLFFISFIYIQLSALYLAENAVAQIVTAEKMRDYYSDLMLKNLFTNINSIDGIEVLIADSTSDRIESAWGHAALRILSKSENIDIIIDFVPEKNISILKSLHGVFGDLRILPVVTRFKDWRYNYSIIEHRSIYSIFIPSSKKIRFNLIEIAINLLNGKTKSNYFFLSQNCISFIFELFKRSGLEFIPDSTILPKEAPITFQSLGLTPYPPHLVSLGLKSTSDNFYSDYSQNKSDSIFKKLSSHFLDPNDTHEIANTGELQLLRSFWNETELIKFCSQTKEMNRILRARSLLADDLNLKKAKSNMLDTILMINKICN